MYQRLYIRRANRALNTSILYNRYRKKILRNKFIFQKVAINFDGFQHPVCKSMSTRRISASPVTNTSQFVWFAQCFCNHDDTCLGICPFILFVPDCNSQTSINRNFSTYFFYVNVIIIVTLTPLHSLILSRSLCTLNLSSNITCDTIQSNAIIVRAPNQKFKVTSNKISSLQLLLLLSMPQQKFAHLTNFIEFEYLTFKAIIVSYSIEKKKTRTDERQKSFSFL